MTIVLRQDPISHHAMKMICAIIFGDKKTYLYLLIMLLI